MKIEEDGEGKSELKTKHEDIKWMQEDDDVLDWLGI